MQVEVDLKCMQTNFGGCDLSDFKDFAPFLLAFKTAKISLWTMDYCPRGSKNSIGSKKFMQVEVDLKCIQTNFCGCGRFGSFSIFTKFLLQTIDYSSWFKKEIGLF